MNRQPSSWTEEQEQRQQIADVKLAQRHFRSRGQEPTEREFRDVLRMYQLQRFARDLLCVRRRDAAREAMRLCARIARIRPRVAHAPQRVAARPRGQRSRRMVRTGLSPPAIGDSDSGDADPEPIAWLRPGTAIALSLLSRPTFYRRVRDGLIRSRKIGGGELRSRFVFAREDTLREGVR